MSTKPTIVLVPGAWHTPECFQYIVPKLEARSYPVVTVSLATVGGKNPEATHVDDIASIHKTIIPLMNAGTEIMLVAHSFGGIPACASVEGQTVAERQVRGERGGISSIFFIAAFAMKKRGMTSSDTFGKQINWMDVEVPFCTLNDNAKAILYHDLTPDQATYWLSRSQQHALASFAKPAEFVAPDLTIPSMYLVCEKDQAMDLSLQEGLIAATPGMKSMRFNGGHSPFLSHPDFMVEAIVKAARELESDRTA